jgi:putative chitinase
MDMISHAQLQMILPQAQQRVGSFIDPLNSAMQEADIVSAVRQAAFLAQVAHESAELLYTRELATGEEYEGRADLGNTQPGDGARFKGRGLLQITGRTNYETCGAALGLDLLTQPQLLETPTDACRSAGWFWRTRDLNALADADAFGAITHKINGGFNGIDARLKYWLRARRVLVIT